MSRVSFTNMCRLLGPLPPGPNMCAGQGGIHRYHGESVEGLAGGERENVSEVFEMDSED